MSKLRARRNDASPARICRRLPTSAGRQACGFRSGGSIATGSISTGCRHEALAASGSLLENPPPMLAPEVIGSSVFHDPGRLDCR